MRFRTLDGLRGIAALSILFYHLGTAAPIQAPSGYLAVDLFFGLSGFVLSHAYGQRLRDGFAWREFAVLRVIRVYPMALLGAAIGVALSGEHYPSLLLLPDFASDGALYPANVPLWSLAFELVVNVAFAALAVRLGRKGLGAIVAGSGAILLLGILAAGNAKLGALWPTAGYGLARTVFSFGLGVAMQRLHDRYAVRRRETRLAWLLPIVLLSLLTHAPGESAAWDGACIFLLLPAVLWLGTIWETPGAPILGRLGDLSYPLYCIHGVVIQACVALSGPPAYLWIVLVLAALWLDSRVDRPLRQWLLVQARARNLVSAGASPPPPLRAGPAGVA